MKISEKTDLIIGVTDTDIDNLILIQKSAIRLHIWFALGIFAFGIILFILGNVIMTNEVVKSIINIGGAFISTLSSFPIREIINRKDKIGIFIILKNQLNNINKYKNDVKQDQKQKIVNLVWEILNKTALT